MSALSEVIIMLELLKFEFYRLYKSKFVWLLAAFAALAPVLAAVGMQVLIVNLGAEGDMDLDKTNIRFFTWFVISYFYERLPLVLALFVPLFIGRDYKDGVIRNKITAGHSRMEIFVSMIIPHVALTAVLSVVYIVFGLIAISLTDFGCDINRGEMFIRALTLLLSLIATTVLFAVISLLIKSRAGTVVLCIVFVFSFSLFSALATNFSYDHRMIEEYVDICDDLIPDSPYYVESQDPVEVDDYFNAGWYIGHPVFLLTNASLGDEFVPTLNNMISSDGMFEYPKKISRTAFANSYMNLFMGNYQYFMIDRSKIDDIKGATVSYTEAELVYNVKSIVWTAIYFGAGYALFRKKNIF